MSTRLIIVGGVAGGATAAARARRLDEDASILVLERGPHISFANCGLPYHIGGEIRQRDALLVQTVKGMVGRFAIDVRVGNEVIAIDRAARKVRVRELQSGREYDEAYDYLLLSPGAAPIRPPIPGLDDPRVHTLRNLDDMDRIKQAVEAQARSAVVVGGGFIGLEMAENLRRRGLDVSIVELLPQVMPPIDPEMATRVHAELSKHGVKLLLNEGVVGFEPAGNRLRVKLRTGASLETDLAVLSVGVRPESSLAQTAGLALGERGAIVVDERMCTSDPRIFAVGDAVQVKDPLFGGNTLVPLAGPANRQARIAVDNIFGRQAKYRGTLGTAIVRVFDLSVASTGASEKSLKSRGIPYQKVYVHPMSHAGYFPGAEKMTIKLLFAKDGRVLGAQIVGGDGVDKRIDVLAMALQAKMTVFDLEDAELAYAPQFGSAKDPVNQAGFVAANVLRGDVESLYAEELLEGGGGDVTVLDVRNADEFEAGHIPGATLIPLPQLRQHLSEIPKDKPVVVYCAAGQRGYYAARTLRQKGYRVRNLSGGYSTYAAVAGTRK